MKKKKVIKATLITTASVLLAAFIVYIVPFVGPANKELWKDTDSFDIANTVVLQKRADRDFVILNLADIQIKDNDYFKIRPNLDLVRKLVDEVKPDLITLTGDQIWGGSLSFDDRWNKVSLSLLIKLMDSFKIPWAPVHGNHDAEAACKKSYIAYMYTHSKYCVYRRGPSNIDGGDGNYIINIKEGEKIVQTLFMMDTKSERYYEETAKRGYDHASKKQIEWYRWGVRGMREYNGGVTVPSMLFMHIPLFEYQEAYDYWESAGFDPSAGFGYKKDSVDSPPVTNGFFDAILAEGSTKNVFVGHNHTSNFSVEYKGVRLTYCTKTGDTVYYDPEINGGTVITIGTNAEIGIRHLYK